MEGGILIRSRSCTTPAVRQVPKKERPGSTTSPADSPLTPGPVTLTTPTPSWPPMKGGGTASDPYTPPRRAE